MRLASSVYTICRTSRYFQFTHSQNFYVYKSLHILVFCEFHKNLIVELEILQLVICIG